MVMVLLVSVLWRFGEIQAVSDDPHGLGAADLEVGGALETGCTPGWRNGGSRARRWVPGEPGASAAATYPLAAAVPKRLTRNFCTLPVRVAADEVAARVVLLLWNTACYVARIVPAMPLGACRMHT